MGTNLIRSVLLASASAAAAAAFVPAAAYAQEASYDLDIPAQPLGDALRALGRATKHNVVFDGAVVRGKRSTAVKGRFSADAALERMLDETGLVMAKGASGSLTVRLGNGQGGAELASSGGEEVAQSEKGISEILVVGSKSQNVDIRRTEDDIQPYTILSAQDIKQSGAQNLEDFLRTRLPMNAQQQSVLQSGVVDDNRTSFGRIDLRGLGTDETLILVDGRRLPSVPGIVAASASTGAAGAGYRMNQSNINGIPLSAVERIEILPSSASGIYGGNATGGVINIVLKRDYNGIDVSFRYGNTFDAAAPSGALGLNAGFSLEGGRTSVIARASFSNASALRGYERHFYRKSAERLLSNQSAVQFFGADSGAVNFCSTSFGSTCDGASLTLDSGLELGSLYGFVPAAYAGPTVEGDMGAALVENAGKFDLDRSPSILWTAPRIASGAISVKRTFNSALDVYVDISSDQQTYRSSKSATWKLSVPASSPYNPFQQSIIVNLPLANLALNGSSSIKNTNFSVGGIIRPFDRFTANVEYRRARGEVNLRSAGLLEDSTGLSSSQQLLLQQYALTDLTQYDIPSIDSIFHQRTISSKTVSTVDVISSHFSGSPFSLPGGDVTVSGLLEYQRERIQPTVSDLGDGTFRWTPKSSRDVKSAYLEARLPLFSTKNAVPLVRALEFMGAVRHDDYETKYAGVDLPTPSLTGPFSTPSYVTNSAASWDITTGLRYSPVRDFTVRLSYGTGFLPPALNQLISREVSVSGTLAGIIGGFDPRRGNTVIGNPAATVVLNGNPNIKPEKSKTVSFGLIATPKAIPNLRISVDYTETRKAGEIFRVPNSFILNNEDLYSDRIERASPLSSDPPGWPGPITYLDVTYLNISKTLVRAVDFNVDYRLVTSDSGQWHAYISGTRQIALRRQLQPGAESIDDLGFSNGPLKWRVNAGLEWSFQNFNVAWNAQYYDEYSICASIDSESTCSRAISSQGSERIPSQLYNDVSLSYQFGDNKNSLSDNLELSLSIQNVFNKTPPSIAYGVSSNFAGYSYYGDPRGRRFTASITKHF